MATQQYLALFQGSLLDGQVATVVGAESWYCPRHAVPVPAELAALLTDQPADACVAYRRHASRPGRVVYRFDAGRAAPVTEACWRPMAEPRGEL